MKTRFLTLIAAMALIFALYAPASATLTVIGQGTITAAGGNNGGVGQTVDLVYSSLLDATILNFSNETDLWVNQADWASDLVVDFGGATLDGWRLPETYEDRFNPYGDPGWEGDPDGDGYYDYKFGYNMYTCSELAILFHGELGNASLLTEDGANRAYMPGAVYGLDNQGPLTALESERYWTSTEYTPNPVFHYFFFFERGELNRYNDYFDSYGLAFLSGNPAPTAEAPLPGAVWLLGSGMAGLIGLRRKFSRS